MMSRPLTLDAIVERAADQFGHVEIVSRRPDRSIHRTTYGAVIGRAYQLARALIGAGIRPGDRVATLMLEPRRAPRGVLRDPARRARCCTRSTCGCRPTRSGSIANTTRAIALGARRRLPDAAARQVPRGGGFERVIVVSRPERRQTTDWRRRRLSGCAASRVPTPSRCRRSSRIRRSALATRAARPGRPRAWSTRTARRIMHSLVSALPDSLALSRRDMRAAGRADVPRQRVGPPACKRNGRRQARLRGPAPRRREPPRL